MRHTVCAFALILGLAAAPVLAQSAAPEKAKPQTAQQQAAPAAKPAPEGGLKVFIDPATKQIRAPQPGEAEALTSRRLTRESATVGSAPIDHRGGAHFVRVDDSAMSYAVVTRNADGSLTFQCVQGKQEADKAVSQPAGKEQANAR